MIQAAKFQGKRRSVAGTAEVRRLSNLRTLAGLALAATFALTTGTVHAQLSGAGASNGPTQAMQVPLSGRGNAGNTVVVDQQTSRYTPQGSANVIDSTITIQGTYMGGVPGVLKDGVLQLTLADALTMGLKQNLGQLAETASVLQAKGQREVAKSELMPQLNTTVAESFERINLRTEGVNLPSIPTSVQFNFL